MRALILCAGLGERLRPVTLKKAKPAVEFLNVPMLAFPYAQLDSFDLSDLVINTHYLPKSVEAAARKITGPNTRLHFTFEPQILGSGGGIWNARKHLDWDEVFAVANGDSVALFDEPDTLEQMLKFHLQKDALATLLVCPLEGVGTRLPGVWMDGYGEVTNFGKAGQKDYLTCFHYASFMLLSQRIWKYLPEGESNILYEVLEPQIAKGEKVYGFLRNDMQWFETGNAKDFLNATQSCLELLADPGGSRRSDGLKSFLQRFAEPYSRQSNLAEKLLIADTCSVGGAKLKGFQVLGENARLGAGAVLENCVVLPEAIVEPGAQLTGQIVTST